MKKTLKTLKDMDKVILIVTIGLFVFGLFNIVTASSQVTALRYHHSNLYKFFIQQLVWGMVGLISFLIIIRIPTKSYYFLGKWSYIIILGLSLLVTFKGNNYKGNQNWLSIGPLNLQPSEFAKIVVIIALALLFEKYFKRLRTKGINHNNMIWKIVAAGLAFSIIIFTQGDLGTLIIITLIFLLMFFVSPIMREEKIKTIGILIGIAAFCAMILIIKNGAILTETQKQRFDFFDPCSKYESGGYQICNGFIAINSGGLLGVGIGNSRQKSYIPESHTDSVFAIIAEEYGLLMTTLILALYVILLYRILKLASNTSSIRGKYMSYGISIYLFLHILVNLGGLLGLMPLTGVPLPFLSYGGSYTIALCISLSIVQRIHIEYKNEKIKV